MGIQFTNHKLKQMRTWLFLMIPLILLLAGCDKGDPGGDPGNGGDDGGIIQEYTDVMSNACDVKVRISNVFYRFNRIEAKYGATKPASAWNVFFVLLTDTTGNQEIEFSIYTPVMEPGDFFKNTTMDIDAVKIKWLGVAEEFSDPEATLKWEKATFQDRKFSGNATFDMTKELAGTVNPGTIYSKQKLRFEFD